MWFHVALLSPVQVKAVALSACERGASKNKRPPIRLQREQAFICSSRILHTENVVNLAVIGLAAFDRVHDIEWHGLVGALEDCRLVHVVPEAANSHLDEVGVKRAPPLTDFSTGEVGKYGVAGPDFADINRAVWILDEVVALHTFVVGLVTWQFRQMQIRDSNDLESLAFQIRDHLFECWETLAIYGEWAVVLLIIDIKINYVGRDFSFAELSCHFPHTRFRIITVPALLIPEREQGR